MMARFKRTKEACSGGNSSISAAMKGHPDSDSLAEFGTEELQEFAQAFKVISGKKFEFYHFLVIRQKQQWNDLDEGVRLCHANARFESNRKRASRYHLQI
jgi:hypothetical protein